MRCTVDECTREAAPHRERCWAHIKRAQRCRPLDTPIGSGSGARYRSPAERVRVAGLVLADASSEDDVQYQRASWRFDRALRNFRRKK